MSLGLKECYWLVLVPNQSWHNTKMDRNVKCLRCNALISFIRIAESDPEFYTMGIMFDIAAFFHAKKEPDDLWQQDKRFAWVSGTANLKCDRISTICLQDCELFKIHCEFWGDRRIICWWYCVTNKCKIINLFFSNYIQEILPSVTRFELRLRGFFFGTQCTCELLISIFTGTRSEHLGNY